MAKRNADVVQCWDPGVTDASNVSIQSEREVSSRGCRGYSPGEGLLHGVSPGDVVTI